MRNSRTHSRKLVSILVAGLALGVAASSASAQTKIRVGYSVVPIHLAPLIFEDKNLAKHQGKAYTTDMLHFRGSAHQLTALAAGELDLAVLAFSTFAAGIVNARQDLVAIADVARDGPEFSSVYGVKSDSAIKSVKDLKGKVLAINAKGGAVDMAARVVLLKNGLKPGLDVNIVEARFGAMESMLRQGKTDVAVFLAPFWPRAHKKGGVRALFHQRDGLGTTQFLLYAAKREFVQKNRAALVAWMEDYIRGVNWLLDPANRQKSLEKAAAFTKRKPEQFAAWAFQKDTDYYHDPAGKIDIAALQSNVDVLKEQGILRKSINAADLVDHSIAEEARKRLAK